MGLLIPIAVGCAFGLIPLIMGISREVDGKAWLGFVICVVAGFLGGMILAAPATGLAVYLVVRETKQKEGE